MLEKNGPGRRLFVAANTLLLAAVFLLLLYPFLYVLSASLSAAPQLRTPLLPLPAGFTLKSYAAALSDPDVYRALLLSASRSVLGPALMLVVNGMAGYVLSRRDLVFGRFLRLFLICTMYFSAGTIPLYLLIKGLHLTNSYLVYLLPTALSAFNIVLIKTYVESLPASLEEAVCIDGGTELDAYWRVILPLCLPINAAVLLFSAITHWNMFLDTQLYNAMSPKLYTMQYVLYNTMAAQTSRTLDEAQKNAAGAVSSQSLRMAVTTITIVPILCVYPFLQRYFISGVMLGSVKE